MNNPSFRQLLKRPIELLAFGFGSGLSPRAPGTIGTLAAIPLYILLSQSSLLNYSLLVVVAATAGIYICGRTSRELGVRDHQGIVWDEFVGYWLAMWGMPFNWYWPLLGFVIFRAFDIAKPWPISWCDRNIHGGFGIMFDDILAGAVTCGILHLLQYWFW